MFYQDVYVSNWVGISVLVSTGHDPYAMYRAK